MLIVTTLYLALIWLLFFKLKWLPWNKLTQWLCILVGAVILTAFLVGLQSLTPASKHAFVSTRMVDIAPQVSGRISKVTVEPRVAVATGDILFEIDPTAYRARLKNLEASLGLARIREDQARALFERQAAALADLQAYEAQVEQLEAQIEGANFDLDNTVVRAPVDGTVPFLALKPGVQVSPSRSVLAMVAADDFIIAARFSQKALQSMKIGDRALVNFPALPGQVFESGILAIPSAVSEGQFIPSGSLPSLQEQRMTRLWPVIVQLPDDFPVELRKAGLDAQVYVHTENAGVVGIVAVILQWVSTSLDAII